MDNKELYQMFISLVLILVGLLIYLLLGVVSFKESTEIVKQSEIDTKKFIEEYSTISNQIKEDTPLDK